MLVTTSHPSWAQTDLDQKAEILLTRTFINAEKDYQIKNYEASIEGFERCITMDPRHAASYFGLGKLHLERQMYGQAETYFEKAAGIDPNNKWYWLSWGQALLAQDKYEEASEVYKNVTKRYPDDIQLELDYANTLLFAGKGKKALKKFDAIEQKLGPNREISRKRYQYYIESGKYDDAADELQKLLNVYPDDRQIYGMLADLYKAQGKLKEALEVYKAAYDADPENPYVQLSLAEYFDRTGARDSSFVYLQKAYLNANLDIDTKVGVLIKMYTEAERYPKVRSEALVLCEAVVQTHPDNAKSYSVFGDYLLLDNQLVEARAQYLKAVEFDPSKFAIWNQIMIIDSELGNNKDLIQDSEAALEYFPAQASLYFFNGIAYNQEGDYTKAVKSLKEGSKLVFGNNALSSQMLASLGDAYHELDRPQSSDSAYDASLSYDPNNPYVLNNYSYFLSLREVRLEEAKEMSARSLEIDPNNASYLDTYGWILFKLGEHEEAEIYLKKSLDNGGEQSAEVLEHYGDTLRALGKDEDAINYWRRAQDLTSDKQTLQEKIDGLQRVD